MAKRGKQPTSGSSSARPTSVPSVIFPQLSLKPSLECRVLLEDQILLVDELLSPQECSSFVKFIDNLPLELTPPKKRGEADRFNHRFSVTSVEFSQRLHSLLVPHLPSFPCPKSVKRSDTDVPRLPHSFNSNIRVYKYTPLQYFGPHYDDSVLDPMTGAKSEWTLLIYLTGIEDGVEGGETLFYKEEKGRHREVITAPLTRGTALLHRHGQECMLHEGSRIVQVHSVDKLLPITAPQVARGNKKDCSMLLKVSSSTFCPFCPLHWHPRLHHIVIPVSFISAPADFPSALAAVSIIRALLLQFSRGNSPCFIHPFF